MGLSVIKPAFTAGEISPALWGRTDLPKFHQALSVGRNGFVNYRGGFSSRAGTLFCGHSLQPASEFSTPPKIVRFQFNIFQSYILEFGDGYMRVAANGAYVTETPLAITSATQANPLQINVPGNGWAVGDWIYAAGVGGMTQINNRTFIVIGVLGDLVSLATTFNVPVSSLSYGAYTSGGTAARIYTNRNAPYAAEDLPYLKVVQSADVMSLCCVNQQTGTEYQPVDLQRLAANNWNFVELTFASSIAAPTGVTAVASTTGSDPYTQYAYVVTAINASTGEESIASSVAYITQSVDIAATAGSHTISWNAVAGAGQYNIYQAPPSYATAVPIGSNFGYIGFAFGTQFVNSNIQSDLTTTPPLHQNPFARGQVVEVNMTDIGIGFDQATVSYTINTSTGSGAVLIPIVVSGGIVAVIVQNPGEDYAATDTVEFNNAAAASATGTYTFVANPTATQTIILNGITWQFVASGATGNQTNIRANTQATLQQLVADLNSSVNGSISVATYTDVGLALTITYDTPGTGGNAYTLAAGTYGGTISGATLAGGAGAGGGGATATLEIGPETGTYPGVVNYFQQRRAYAATLNNPDTYFMSQTGAYLNFDSSTPPIDSDAIIATPWGEQVNGIQWLQPMPGGLIAATGLDTWQLAGTGGAGSLITPAQQSASPQESNGYSPTVRPLKINYDILYLGRTNAVYDLVYNFWNNIYAGTDISVMSSHMFDGFQLLQWAWARQPFKLVWATRSDGKFLSLTFLKEQELIAWTRHDTNGLVVDNEVATESSVDAPYFMVKRYIVGQAQWAYYLERMDNRQWTGPEDPWCIDAGLALPQPTPNATLSAAAANGPGNISGAYLAAGGQGYVNPSADIVDPTGLGSGGLVTLTEVSGVITGFTFTPGQDYSPSTYCQISDSTGAGASIVLFISQNVLFTASEPVFANNNAGDVIRIGGGIADVTEIVSPTQVLANIVSPILQTIPNDPYNLPIPAAPGDWSITTPVSVISNLEHLEGMQVSVLADGAVVAGGDEPTLTVVNGQITLSTPASSIKVGLPFIVQAQSMHSEIPGVPTMQGKFQEMDSLVARVQATRGIQVGANQPVAAALPYQQEIPWSGMRPVPDQASIGLSQNAIPLFTGDYPRISVGGGPQNWNGFEAAPGMAAVQQLNPLPLNLLALMPDLIGGETNSQA